MKLLKKLITFILIFSFVFCLVSCNKNAEEAENSRNYNLTEISSKNENKNANEGENTAITLSIGNKVLNGYLNNSKPAQSLISQLPLTVSLNDSGNDFCGDSISIDYDDSDVEYGYKNGDLAFWTPASNFVIFVDDEEFSENTGDLIILGKITESQDVLNELQGNIDVKIELADRINNTENDKEAIEVKSDDVKIKITAGGNEVIAELEDNATTRALIEKLPMTLPMMDLYGREMCYRFNESLPTENLRSDGYSVGDLAYWVPGHSFVILYKQNGENFERQHLGHIDSGVDIFDGIGDVEVTFEVME